MKTLPRSDIPIDYTYYRTGSRIWFDYYKKFTRLLIWKIGSGYEFFTAFQALPGFYSITVEKNDIEINREILKKSWISHGIVWWTPIRKTDKSRGWWRVPTWFTKWDIHASRSAFSMLDTPEYWNKWSWSARAHRRHVLENRSIGKIRISSDESIEKFLELYNSTKIHDPNKLFVARMTDKLFSQKKDGYRVFMIYVDDVPLAGAVFIDEWVTSEYWASFYHEDARQYHLGIAMMDAWYLDSFRKWIRYCDLDHMRDSGQLSSYAGYTEFKSSIADHDIYFHDMWIRIF